MKTTTTEYEEHHIDISYHKENYNTTIEELKLAVYMTVSESQAKGFPKPEHNTPHHFRDSS